jgi:hypothetical protein
VEREFEVQVLDRRGDAAGLVAGGDHDGKERQGRGRRAIGGCRRRGLWGLARLGLKVASGVR